MRERGALSLARGKTGQGVFRHGPGDLDLFLQEDRSMGTPEFPDLGRHCSVDDCKLIDFLPFACDRCEQVFCLEHRTYSKHNCPTADRQDVTVLVCPLCAKGVRLVPNEDPNITWATHVNTDCDPSNYQKVTKKPRCPVANCKEILTFSNKIRCRDCNQEHCLKHRFGPDHKCPGPKTPASFVGFLRKNQRAEPQSTRKAAKAEPQSAWATGLMNAASSMRASAEAGISKLSSATSQAIQKARDGVLPSWEARGSSNGSSSNNGSGNQASIEQCLQCQARFSSVSKLIEHVEKAHERGSGRVAVGEILDVCPKCNREFQDPVSLVQHVERDHRGSSTT
ncbi:zinc finger AN1 and C2H2 domain-containing stress-associated protein 16-like isoform X1 [Nymphaea colorata]|nr:zinc finger AN1 and C2H2 domain-containing stress-associated protein 16-like isoform X1 [Nymphaea colorata]